MESSSEVEAKLFVKGKLVQFEQFYFYKSDVSYLNINLENI